MRISSKTMIILLSILLLALPLLAACSSSSDDDDKEAIAGPATGPPVEPVTITVGNLTDKTGVASNAMSIIDKALDDTVEYYNENNLIPGVELEVVSYDEQYDPSKDIPGYEWLKERGADFLWTPVTSAVDTLLPTLNQDQFVMFAATANLPPEEMESGYVFSLGITPKYEALTLLKWLPENDPDFPKDRPAKIGGAAWSEAYSDVWFSTAKAYAEIHPDQYEWEGGYLAPLGTFIWDTEIQALKDCDYAYIPIPPHVFARGYREAGHSAKLLGSDPHAAFLGMVHTGDLWDQIDGMLFIRSSRWYNEQGPIVDLTNQFLDEKRPGEADAIRQEGCGYIAVKQIFLMLQIVKETVEAVGAENFSSQALFDAASSWSYSLYDIDDFNSFSETKRFSQNYYAVYEARAAEKDIFRMHDEWLPQVTEP